MWPTHKRGNRTTTAAAGCKPKEGLAQLYLDDQAQTRAIIEPFLDWTGRSGEGEARKTKAR
jgi:hypothetical protein